MRRSTGSTDNQRTLTTEKKRDETMKVDIKKWHQVVSWHWDVPNDDLCGICRGSFESTCNTCKYPGDDCPLVFGECKHAFHLHCLRSWLSQDVAKGLCPMCRQVFKSTDKGITISTSAVPFTNQQDSIGEQDSWD